MANTIRERADLIDFLSHCEIGLIRRACIFGTVENLGGFSPLVGQEDGWLLRVMAKWGQVLLVAVLPTWRGAILRVREDIPWDRWVGPLTVPNPLFEGDHPAEYAKLREQACSMDPLSSAMPLSFP